MYPAEEGDNKYTIVGVSEAMREVVALVDRVAQSDCCVLIEGESGTGKELAARRLHARSRRHAKPLIPVNCAGVSETLFESQFFGHVRGAFTGAQQSILGLVRTAEGGTLFMDEVGEIPFCLQPKLLRVLQDGEVLPVGSASPIPTNTRFLAASNRDLREGVAQGRFRADLFYRLNIVRIYLPALRDRPEDVECLLEHFLRLYADRYDHSPITVGKKVRRELTKYKWRGNVRELASWVERLYATGASPEALLGSLLADSEKPMREVAPQGAVSLQEAERWAIRRAMQQAGNNHQKAASLLQIHRSTLARKLRDYEME